MNNFLILFIFVTIINVVFSTVKSITTIKGSKTMASLVSGGYYAYYNLVIIFTVSDFPLWIKCVVTFGCNVVGVWVVKFLEEKFRKDKLWKIEVTAKSYQVDEINFFLKSAKLPFSFVIDETKKYAIYNIYCQTQAESLSVKELIKIFNVKYFITEAKEM